MKKILILFSLAGLLTVNSSLAVACGAADGPQVATSIQDPTATDKPFLNTNSSKFPNAPEAPPSGYSFKFTGINEYLMLPALTMINSDKTESQSGAKFSNAVYDDALRGSSFRQQYQALSHSDEHYKDWTDFFKVFNSPADTYFTSVQAEPDINPTYTGLSTTYAYKDLANSNYFTKDKTKDIANAGKNLVTFSEISSALAKLNTPQYLASPTAGSAGQKNITQEASSALLFIGNIKYTFTYEGGDKKYIFKATFNNLVAHLQIAAFSTDKKTYYQGWVLAGYDYYNQQTLNNWVAAATANPGTAPHQVKKDGNLYIGYHDSINTEATATRGKGTDKGEFSNQTTSKKDINYPDITFKIAANSIVESSVD